LSSEPKSQRDISIVVPGERVAVIEEYFASDNTYVSEGDIIAKVVGRVVADYEDRKIRVVGFKRAPLPKKGESVYAVVTRIKDISATLSVFYIEDRKLELLPPITGILHVLNISTTYVRNIYDALGYGDIVRAQVIVERPPPVILSLRGREYGVIYAKCPYCMRPLKKRGFTLYCFNCRKNVKRKIAAQYRV